MEWWLIYLLTGAFVGFFAGLLGIGGGLIIVPVLISLFTAQDFPADRIIHLALGTTMATIIFTSAASLRTHHRHGAVNWPVVKNITPGIFLGTFGGATLAGSMTGQLLSIIFVIFIFYAATQMLLQFRPSPMFQLPGRIGLFLVGNVIGALSSLVAIGGGLLSVPFLTLCNVKLQHAIGTAAAIPGTLVNLAAGGGERTAVRFGHPSGTLRVGAEARQVGGDWVVTKAIMSRSARVLMEGWVRVPGEG